MTAFQELIEKLEYIKENNCKTLQETVFFNGVLAVIDAEKFLEKEKQQKEDFAIGFAEWLGLNCYNDFSKWKMYEDDDTIFEIKELLEIYKKEKGL